MLKRLHFWAVTPIVAIFTAKTALGFRFGSLNLRGVCPPLLFFVNCFALFIPLTPVFGVVATHIPAACGYWDLIIFPKCPVFGDFGTVVLVVAMLSTISTAGGRVVGLIISFFVNLHVYLIGLGYVVLLSW
jgi:hypothetical protein